MSNLWTSPDDRIVIGIDEAGRGCWAGPVVAGAAWLKPGQTLGGALSTLNDSKKLNAARRAALVEPIKEACYWGIGEASAAEIDQINILQATFLAMERALAMLLASTGLLEADCPHYQLTGGALPDIQIDGSHIPPIAPAGWSIRSVVKGDGKIAAIAAASILAKEHRDALMTGMDAVYPGYGFEQHKSYGTAAHMAALQKLGPCPIHRATFRPIAKMLAGR